MFLSHINYLVFPVVCWRGGWRWRRQHRRQTWSDSLRWSSSRSCSMIHWFNVKTKPITVKVTVILFDCSEWVNESYLSVVCLMLAERSRRTGPGSMVGSPVAEVVVVQVEEILRSNPGGRLRLRRCNADKQTGWMRQVGHHQCTGTGQDLKIEGFSIKSYKYLHLIGKICPCLCVCMKRICYDTVCIVYVFMKWILLMWLYSYTQYITFVFDLIAAVMV